MCVCVWCVCVCVGMCVCVCLCVTISSNKKGFKYERVPKKGKTKKTIWRRELHRVDLNNKCQQFTFRTLKKTQQKMLEYQGRALTETRGGTSVASVLIFVSVIRDE